MSFEKIDSLSLYEERMKDKQHLIYITFGVVFFSIILSLITFIFAKGTAYLSDNPQSCNNCHVMNETYQSWKNSNHHHVTVCNDCHVPNNFIGKWLTKAENGFHHSIAFTFKDIPVAIQAREISKKITVENCIRCHGNLMHQNNLSLSNNSSTCINCHKNIGHLHP